MTTKTARGVAIGLIALTALLIAGLAVWRTCQRTVRHIEPDRERYPVWGIDISAHNGTPDFDSISAAGASFVYLKASEGMRFHDASFRQNYDAARNAGLMIGAYHFFRFDRDGRAQAVNALRAIEGCELDLPLAIDIEESGNPAGINTEMVRSRLQAMVSHLQGAGHKVIIYTNKTGDARFLRNYFDNEAEGDPELWICSFTNPPIRRRPWRLWQHSHLGRVPGLEREVDLNVFNGDADAWAGWLAAQKGHESAQ